MHTHQDVPVGVHFEQVPVHRVKHQASEKDREQRTGLLRWYSNVKRWKTRLCSVSLPGGERRVVDEVEQLLRVSNRHQALHCQVKAQRLVLWRFIHYRQTGTEARVHNTQITITKAEHHKHWAILYRLCYGTWHVAKSVNFTSQGYWLILMVYSINNDGITCTPCWSGGFWPDQRENAPAAALLTWQLCRMGSVIQWNMAKTSCLWPEVIRRSVCLVL